MAKETGGPAFPVAIDDVRDFSAYGKNNLTGMTLRDWFAGQALAGMLASEAPGFVFRTPDEPVKRVYAIADAMLAERNKEQ